MTDTKQITGKIKLESKVVSLSDKINLLLKKFAQIKFGFGKAKNVNEPEGNRSMTQNCAICFDDIHVDQMFQITGCRHSYCFSCMSKHVQFKLLQGIIIPKCPHENCQSQLKLESCRKFLTPELFDEMSKRVKEASIPAVDRIYCPYPKCSSLLSKTELKRAMANANIVAEARKCPQCNFYFCINCKAPWHYNMSCSAFERINLGPNEDKELMYLAIQNLWRQCSKCNHMVSLAEGCYHIYCRCGHEFCYRCGAEWKNKKATCKCPVWDERNIQR